MSSQLGKRDLELIIDEEYGTSTQVAAIKMREMVDNLESMEVLLDMVVETLKSKAAQDNSILKEVRKDLDVATKACKIGQEELMNNIPRVKYVTTSNLNYVHYRLRTERRLAACVRCDMDPIEIHTRLLKKYVADNEELLSLHDAADHKGRPRKIVKKELELHLPIPENGKQYSSVECMRILMNLDSDKEAMGAAVKKILQEKLVPVTSKSALYRRLKDAKLGKPIKDWNTSGARREPLKEVANEPNSGTLEQINMQNKLCQGLDHHFHQEMLTQD